MFLLSRGSHRFRAAALSVAGIVLAWLAISKSLVAFLADTLPEAALTIAPEDSVALLNLAERHGAAAAGAGASPGAGPNDELRLRAETALAGDPVNARALRILGQLADAAGDKSRAVLFMRTAARRSVYESTAVLWLAKTSYEQKDHAAALHYADILMRTRSRAMPLVLPILSRMAEDPEAAPGLHKLLAGNPPWRRDFLRSLPAVITDARTPLKLLLPLRDTAAPPALAEIREYVNVLLNHNFHDLAYYTWLQFLPPEQLGGAGFLFNGSFEHAPSGLPFDWTLGGGPGATVEIAPRPDKAGERALRIGLGPGRVDLQGVTQTLLLAPGAYRFKGKYRGEVKGTRGLVWRIACAGGAGTQLGQSPMALGVAKDWKDVELAFTVPATGCKAQQLRLVLDARSASEQLVSGSVWYDELSIAPIN
jgi:hypothetical protein